jgi:hypothetical protein
MKLKELRTLSRQNVIGKDEFVCAFQNASDITKIIRRSEYESRNFAKKLAPFFKKTDDEKTCELVWKFLREYIDYRAEPKEKQTGMTIARFFLAKRGDCKHYSTSAVGILNACGIPAWFVVVRQSDIDKTKFHAYCQALVRNRIVTVDPCRNKFNSECRFVKKYSIQPIKK